MVLATWSATGCRKKSPRIPTPSPVAVPREETGIASWYGHPYHGRRTANGEVYDMNQLTAAHRTRPFGSWVRVRNLQNGKTVDVRINDRGPFVRGRIIDLSRKAARKIDMIGPGTAKVRVRTLAGPPPAKSKRDDAEVSRTPTGRSEKPPSPEAFAVQIGAFANLANAELLRDETDAAYGCARLVPREGAPRIWRVLVGCGSDWQSAFSLAARVRAERGEAFVVRLD
jgi:rare lipoprotein A